MNEVVTFDPIWEIKYSEGHTQLYPMEWAEQLHPKYTIHAEWRAIGEKRNVH
jgi:hypothetical protein